MTGESARVNVYPLTAVNGEEDRRFTYGLLHEVACVIEAHGYPRISNGPDFMELHLRLFRFLYGDGEA